MTREQIHDEIQDLLKDINEESRYGLGDAIAVRSELLKILIEEYYHK